MSERDTETLQADELVQWEDQEDELPRRPRRRLLTPLTGALVGVLLAACGFLAGALVEKGQAKGSSSSATPAGLGRRAGAVGPGAAGAVFGGGGRAGGASPTVGQVSTVRGRILDVTDSQGNTLRVRIPAGVTVTRAAPSSVHAIHPGDTVVVQGSRGRDGTISASTVRASAATQGGGGALQQLFGGGGARGGGQPSGF